MANRAEGRSNSQPAALPSSVTSDFTKDEALITANITTTTPRVLEFSEDLSDSYSGSELDSPSHEYNQDDESSSKMAECVSSELEASLAVSVVQSVNSEKEIVRRISVVDTHQATPTMVYKQGHLLRQTKTLGRWVKRYCTIEGHHLFMTKSKDDKIREEVLLKDATMIENSTQNVNNSFTIMTPQQSVILAATSRKEMEEWLTSIKHSIQTANNSGIVDNAHHLDGQHSWFSCTHPRPVYCNVCGEIFHGVPGWRGLSCEVCKFKCHRHCVFKVKQLCKWTTRNNLEKDGADILTDFSFPHQWIEGNLPSGSKCTICKRACGSLKRLQDFRCLWCKWTVHTDCKQHVQPMCTLGSLHLSMLPPSAVQPSNDIIVGMWEPFKLPYDPVLAFVNSKSGDNKGVRFLRRLKYWLNPLQVFDLAISGPEPGLQLFQRLNKFRVIIFGGDGSIGWVLSTIDKMHLHSKCIVGVVPLGTGNDLARVLGWGAQCSDEERIPNILSEMECSSYRLLDRWSIQFTTDPNISLVKGHHRSRSNGSNYSNEGKSPLPLTPEENTGKSLGGTDAVESIAVSTSVSSYHSTRSYTPSSVDSSDNIESTEIAHNKVSPNPVAPLSLPAVNDKYDSHHLVVVTPPEDLPFNKKLWLESLRDSVMSHLSMVLTADQCETQVISSAQMICEVVRRFLMSLQKLQLDDDEYCNDPFMQKCSVLDDKLRKLLSTLSNKETTPTSSETSQLHKEDKKEFQVRDSVLARANSLKKALENVVDSTEKINEVQDTIVETSVDNTVKEQVESPTSPSDEIYSPSSDVKELFSMNNYFGIGLDAKIAYEFHTRREENPAQFKNRARNKILYGYLGGREFFTNTQRYLERKLSLECDGKEVSLPPRLQGLVFLNIPSYMAGTNFWGTEREKDGFNAPAMDDKLLEVVGVTGFTHLATTKVLGIQNHRIAQCRSAKVIIHSELMLQVDGEAWIQEPGIILVTHKNKAKLIVKDKAFIQSLESWCMKHTQAVNAIASSSHAILKDVLKSDDIKKYYEVANSVRSLIQCLNVEFEYATNSELMSHITATTVCMERIFPTPENISETADIEHLQDFESSVKALVQELLWYLNMNKISNEREDEIRGLTSIVETQLKRIVIPQNLISAQESYRRASDSLLVHRPLRYKSKSPLLGSHRERAVHIGDSNIVYCSIDTARKIGKDVNDWNVDDVCSWLSEIGFSEYVEDIVTHNITGPELMEMRTEDMQGIGIKKISHQSYLRQALQALNSSKNSFTERRSTN